MYINSTIKIGKRTGIEIVKVKYRLKDNKR